MLAKYFPHAVVLLGALLLLSRLLNGCEHNCRAAMDRAPAPRPLPNASLFVTSKEVDMNKIRNIIVLSGRPLT